MSTSVSLPQEIPYHDCHYPECPVTSIDRYWTFYMSVEATHSASGIRRVIDQMKLLRTITARTDDQEPLSHPDHNLLMSSRREVGQLLRSKCQCSSILGDYRGARYLPLTVSNGVELSNWVTQVKASQEQLGLLGSHHRCPWNGYLKQVVNHTIENESAAEALFSTLTTFANKKTTWDVVEAAKVRAERALEKSNWLITVGPGDQPALATLKRGAAAYRNRSDWKTKFMLSCNCPHERYLVGYGLQFEEIAEQFHNSRSLVEHSLQPWSMGSTVQ